MAKANQRKGRAEARKGTQEVSERKQRGRTHITGAFKPSPTRPNVPETMRAEATRPVTAGGTKHRGDRRDTNRTYTGNVRHSARGSNPRRDVSTRKR